MDDRICDRSRHSDPASLVRRDGEPLGKGAFGEVISCLKAAQPRALAAEHPLLFARLPERFAVKVPTKAAGLEVNEFKAQHTLASTHPDMFARLYGCISLASGITLTFMDQVDGIDLREFLHTRSRSEARKVLPAVVASLTRGIVAMHKAEIVHRDIKPANLMVSADGSVFIMDLGVSCGRRINPCRTVAGTPGYVHPIASGFAATFGKVVDLPHSLHMMNDLFAAAVTVSEVCEKALNFVSVVSKHPVSFPRESVNSAMVASMANPTSLAGKKSIYLDLKKVRKHMCRVFHTSAFLMSAAGRDVPGLEAFAAIVSKDPTGMLIQDGDGRPMFSAGHRVDWEAFQAAVYASVKSSAEDIHLCFDEDEILAFPTVE